MQTSLSSLSHIQVGEQGQTFCASGVLGTVWEELYQGMDIWAQVTAVMLEGQAGSCRVVYLSEEWWSEVGPGVGIHEPQP